MGGASPARIRSLAMDYLARREHGCAELVGKLVARGVREDIATNIVTQLSNEGLQDDERFADGYLNAQVNRGKGPLYIRNGLRQRGLSGAEAEQAIQRANVDWLAQARQVARKKFANTTPTPAEYASRQRFLLQRGFTPEQCGAALRNLHADSGDD